MLSVGPERMLWAAEGLGHVRTSFQDYQLPDKRYTGCTAPNAPWRDTRITNPKAPAAISNGKACPLIH